MLGALSHVFNVDKYTAIVKDLLGTNFLQDFNQDGRKLLVVDAVQKLILRIRYEASFSFNNIVNLERQGVALVFRVECDHNLVKRFTLNKSVQ